MAALGTRPSCARAQVVVEAACSSRGSRWRAGGGRACGEDRYLAARGAVARNRAGGQAVTARVSRGCAGEGKVVMKRGISGGVHGGAGTPWFSRAGEQAGRNALVFARRRRSLVWSEIGGEEVRVRFGVGFVLAGSTSDRRFGSDGSNEATRDRWALLGLCQPSSVGWLTIQFFCFVIYFQKNRKGLL